MNKKPYSTPTSIRIPTSLTKREKKRLMAWLRVKVKEWLELNKESGKHE